MSSEEDDQQVLTSKKKYRLWKDGETISIPFRTVQRWEKRIPCDKGEQRTVDGPFIKVTDNVEAAGVSQTDSNDDNDDSDSSTEFNSRDDYTDESTNATLDIENDFCEINHTDFVADENDADNVLDNNDIEDNDDEIDSTSNNNPIRKLLYENSTMSIDESVLSLMELYVHHKWTKASLTDCLKMLRNILPEDNEMPRSTHKLLQYVQNGALKFCPIKHFFCKKCVCYNGRDDTIDKCCSCGAAEKLKQPISCDDRDIISDITDGSEYIRINSRENRQKYDLTLMLSTDGLQLVASSKSHCWPLTFMIMELPEHLRESFLIIIGLWYDDTCKPNMNCFLQPFCSKLKECYDEGIHWVHPKTGETFVSRVVAPLIIADAPARAQIQNMQNFNGKYGCNICEIKMKQAKRIEGKRSNRIYPCISDAATIRLRTGRRIQKQAIKALRKSKTHVKGVKGSSVIMDLPFINLGTCLIPEYMHSVLLGVGRQFLDIWVAKKGACNIKKDIQAIDKFLLSIRPPHFFNRMPRSLMLLKFYKASEYYNFILFYSLPVLVDYLANEYLQHWILLVKALFILLQERIPISDLELAESLLKLFVKRTKTLYSDRELTYNVHQLLHLVLVVRRWGPLWATSAFPFENFNGFLANCVHGIKNFGQEIINKLKIAQGVQTLRYRVNQQNAIRTNSLANGYELLGKGSVIKFDDMETELLATHNLDLENLLVYSRAKIGHANYTSKMYKTINTNSYTVQVIHNDNSVIYGSIRFFFEMGVGTLCFLLNCFTVQHTKIFHNTEIQAKLDHILPIKEDKTFCLIKLNSIKCIQHLI